MTNREIKFRAWDKKAERWVYQGYSINEVAANGYELDGMDVIWLEWTGLKDKNRVDIFGGDIVKCSRNYWDDTRNLVVDWHEASWGLLNVGDPVDSETLNPLSGFCVPENDREVIGNVYENPELLEEGHDK